VRFPSGSVRCFGDDGRLGHGVVGLYEDSRGNLWAGVKDGLWRWKPGPPKFYSLPGEVDGIQAIGEDADGALLVGWKSGIYRFLDGKTEPHPLGGAPRQFPGHQNTPRSRWWSVDRNRRRGVVHIHQGRMDLFSPTDGLSGDGVSALFEDREGNIWIATLEGSTAFVILPSQRLL